MIEAGNREVQENPIPPIPNLTLTPGVENRELEKTVRDLVTKSVAEAMKASQAQVRGTNFLNSTVLQGDGTVGLELNSSSTSRQ